jgi:hypothetical protein
LVDFSNEPLKAIERAQPEGLNRVVLVPNCESSRPLSVVLVINDNYLWTNGSWRNKNAGWTI